MTESQRGPTRLAEPSGPGRPAAPSPTTARTGEPPAPGGAAAQIIRISSEKLRRVDDTHLRATETAFEPPAGLDRLIFRLKRLLLGRPLATAEAHHERLPKTKALAVFASDALSSSAYAPEEILLVLAAAGAAGLAYGLPIAVAIVVLLGIVAFSYSQTIRSYPGGGGTYIVTRDNLGPLPSLIAASALLIGYILTVAVSISAGVAAITSALPALAPYRVELAVACIALLTLANLRGVSESGTIFAVPTYLFIVALLVTLAAAGSGVLTGRLTPEPATSQAGGAVESVGLFLVLRAFVSGCAALTGTEAIADGVPAFKPPETKNAQITLACMAAILATLFFGIMLVAHALQLVPRAEETLVSQIARLVWGSTPVYYVVQAATMLILVLAANTAFADFPRVNYFLARDDFLPHYFQIRGDRLALTSGILLLAAVAAALVVVFRADVTALIPLYAIGVFIAFTFSQASMVRRWWRGREPGWQASLPVNIVGTLTTGSVAAIAAVTKFGEGAWVVLILVPALVALMWAIHGHYAHVERQLELGGPPGQVPEVGEQVVLVPVSRLNRASEAAIAYARSISSHVQAVHITDEPDSPETAELRRRWGALRCDVPLIILESPTARWPDRCSPTSTSWTRRTAWPAGPISRSPSCCRSSCRGRGGATCCTTSRHCG